MRTAPRAIALMTAAAVVLLVAGCGSDTLWARWRAERDLWRADHAAAGTGSDTPALTRAAARYRRVAERWPASAWVPRAAADSFAADVARIGGRAAVRAATLTWEAGDRAAAASAFDDVERAWAPVWPVGLEAALAHAAAAAQSGDSASACGVRERMARRYPLLAPGGAAADSVIAAARGVAVAHRNAGHAGQADSAWRALAARLERAIGGAADTAAVPRLWLALAGARAGLGPEGRAGARAALDRVLDAQGARALAGDALLELGRLALDDGDAPRAIVVARRARAALPWERGLDAVVLEASAWERAGRIDSALVTYGRAVDEHWAPEPELTRARAGRARLFERAGRWEEARGELHALIAADPLSRYAFDAMRRLVGHHVERREPELADLEATWCVERLDRTLATVLDPGVLLAARRARADLLLAVGFDRRAFAALEDLWRRHPGTPDGVWAGFRAAELAEQRLDDRAAATRLYRELAAGAPDPGQRREAVSRARRLGAGG